MSVALISMQHYIAMRILLSSGQGPLQYELGRMLYMIRGTSGIGHAGHPCTTSSCDLGRFLYHTPKATVLFSFTLISVAPGSM